MNILEKKIWGIRIAAKYRALGIRGPPAPPGAILGPNNLIHHHEASLAHSGGEVSTERKGQQTMIRMLVNVRSNEANFAAWL